MKNKQIKVQMIQWLGDIIDTELDEPDEQVNIELIDACGHLMNELIKENIRFSEK